MKNKTILITGGTSGIGKELVRQLHKTNQIIVCSRNPQKIKTCQQLFKNVHFIEADISDFERMIAVKNTISETYGYLDILFNNAGTANMVDLNTTSAIDNFDDITINFSGTVHTTSIFIPLLQRS